MANIAVVLSGAGVQDGSEIHEATLTLYFLECLGVNVQCFAPNRPQHHVVHHVTGEPVPDQKRNILQESARIARGDVLPLTALDVNAWDAILLPGGFGAAKNWCDYAFKGEKMTVADDMAILIMRAYASGKVLGCMCIAPVILARLLPGVQVTVGHACEASKHIEIWGGRHIEAAVDEVVWDDNHRVASVPAYMLAQSIQEVATGIEALCHVVLRHLDRSEPAMA